MIRYDPKKLEEPTSDDVRNIFMIAQSELNSRKELYERYRRKLSDEVLASISDEEIKVALEYYITNMAVGYFSGKEPKYTVKEYNEERKKIIEEIFSKKVNEESDIKEVEELIKHISDYNDDSAEFRKLAFDFFCKRACYELLYENDENEYVYASSDALETIGIWDYSVPKNLIGIMRCLEKTNTDGKYYNFVELITENGKYYFDDSKNTDEQKILFQENVDMKQPNKWENDIPAFAIENEDGLSIFELLISLIKGYERSIQNGRNTFKYNDEAILMLKNYTTENDLVIIEEGKPQLNPARKLEDEQLLQSKTFYVGEDGDIKWVEKNIQDSALQNHKKTIMDLICLISGVPNFSDLGFTNAENSSALEKKFFPLEQVVTPADKEFKKAFLRRWELILNKINKKFDKKYDFRDIETQLQRNLPTDKKAETERVLDLLSLLSNETLIGMLPDDLDPQSELEKKKNEEQETYPNPVQEPKIDNFQNNKLIDEEVEDNDESTDTSKSLEES